MNKCMDGRKEGREGGWMHGWIDCSILWNHMGIIRLRR